MLGYFFWMCYSKYSLEVIDLDKFIKGQYRKSVYEGDNGYTVGVFKVQDSSIEFTDFVGKTVTFTGYFHELSENDTYIFYGDFVNHFKYGEQFSVGNYERLKPEDKDSIVEFLSSGLFKGIGEKKAKKIVEVLGKDTLNIIIENKDNLLLIPTITKKQVDILHDTLVEYEASYQTILYLNELGFNTKDSMRIYNKYKMQTKNKIEEDIYSLIEIKDISYKKIDKIALDMNYSKEDERRIKASVFYVMEEVCFLYGHTYLILDEIYHYTIRLLKMDISEELIVKALSSLVVDLKVVLDEDKYYLKELYDAEENIAKRIKYLLKRHDNKVKNLDNLIEDLEKYSNINYNREQLDAIRNSILKNFLVITGGPGTGKTTIIKAIVDLYQSVHKINFERLNEEVVLLAPTGRASKRISEFTSLPAYTIHRFLKWNKETDKFAINEYNKSKVKLVIVDEASMIDVSLFNHLLKGIGVDASIIMVGDYNQLPSVGPGQVLNDIIRANVSNIIELQYLYRQKEGSSITDLAYDINDGNINLDALGEDVNFFEVASSEVVKKLIDVCTMYKNKDYKDFQVLVPMYKGINGIDNLNVVLQNIFNPKDDKKNEYKYGDVIYRVGDKILQLSNMPEENVFNGDIGIITSISKKEIIIDFDSNVVKYTPSNFNNFKHGYAISIHKAQGSEFDIVVLPVVKEYSKMLYKKLYYTAVTRSKNKLYIVGNKTALVSAIRNDKSDIRRTTLCERLIKKMAMIE